MVLVVWGKDPIAQCSCRPGVYYHMMGFEAPAISMALGTGHHEPSKPPRREVLGADFGAWHSARSLSIGPSTFLLEQGAPIIGRMKTLKIWTVNLFGSW